MNRYKVKFLERKQHGDIVFEKDCVYDLFDSPNGFVQRWIDRGCKVVDDSVEAERDPRFPNEPARRAIKEEVKEVEVEPVVEKEVKKKTKKKTKKKIVNEDI